MIYTAQILGFLSLVFLCLSYLSKTRRSYLSNQVTANVLYCLQYFCLGAKTAFISSLVSTVKTIIFNNEEKKKGKIDFWLLILFEIIYLLVGIFTYDNVISIIPIFIALIYTWAAWQPNLKITCSVGILVGLLWVVYNANVGAYVSIIGGIVESISGLIGLIRHIKGVESDGKKDS